MSDTKNEMKKDDVGFFFGAAVVCVLLLVGWLVRDGYEIQDLQRRIGQLEVEVQQLKQARYK